MTIHWDYKLGKMVDDEGNVIDVPADDPTTDLPAERSVHIGEAQLREPPALDAGSKPGARIDYNTGKPLEGDTPEFEQALAEFDKQHPQRHEEMRRKTVHDAGAPPAGDVLPMQELPPKPDMAPPWDAADLSKRPPIDVTGPARGPAEPYKPAGEVSGLEQQAPPELPAAPNSKLPLQVPEREQDPTQAKYIQAPAEKDSHQAMLDLVAKKYRELYGNDDQGGVPEGPAYQPYQAAQRPDDHRRVWAINTLFGQPGDNIHMAQLLQQRDQQLDQNDHQAKQDHLRSWIDQQKAVAGQGHVSLAQAQQAYIAGHTDADGAVHMRNNDPVLKTLGQLGGLRQRDNATDAKLATTAMREKGNDNRLDQKQGYDAQKFAAQDETTRRGQDANLRLFMAKRQGLGDPAQQAEAFASTLASHAGVPLETAKAFIAGDESSVPPNKLDALKTGAGMLASLPVDAREKVAQSQLGAQARNIAAPGVAADRARADPKQRMALKKDYGNFDQELRDAHAGWKVLAADPVALDMYVKLGQGGSLGKWANYARTPEQQAAGAAITRALSKEAIRDGGKSFTSTESTMQSAGGGVDLGAGMDFFKSPAVLSDFLKALNEKRKRMRSTIQTEYHFDPVEQAP